MSIYAISGLPEITDEEQKFLCDNPNTADIVDWVREYAAKATHALRQQLEEAQKVVRCEYDNPCRFQTHAPASTTGFVVADANGTRFRMWGDSGPEWTSNRSVALHFARRCDAESFCAEDEDAWKILPGEAEQRLADAENKEAVAVIRVDRHGDANLSYKSNFDGLPIGEHDLCLCSAAATNRAPAPIDNGAKRCRECNSPRTGEVCWKCNGPTFTPHHSWVEAELPSVARIRELAKEVGYAIGEHGSKERDLDLIAAPWADNAVSFDELITHISAGINAKEVGPRELKPCGRIGLNLQIDGYYKLIDLSICPIPPAADARVKGLESALNIYKARLKQEREWRLENSECGGPEVAESISMLFYDIEQEIAALAASNGEKP